MARIRTIKPEFFLDYELSKLDAITRLFFIGLWLQADKAGRLKDEPEKLKVQIIPWEKTEAEKCLAELANGRWINRYINVKSGKIIQITNWHHQKPHHTEKPSELPSENEEITVIEPLNNGVLTENIRMEGKGREGKGREVKENIKRKVFQKPSPLDVENYAQTISFKINGQSFCDFYESKNWMIGKSPMKNWQAAVRTWKNKSAENVIPPPEPKKVWQCKECGAYTKPNFTLCVPCAEIIREKNVPEKLLSLPKPKII